MLAGLGVEKLLGRRAGVVGGMKVKENCLWCFNNILAEQTSLQKWLVENDMLKYLSQMLKESPNDSQI